MRRERRREKGEGTNVRRMKERMAQSTPERRAEMEKASWFGRSVVSKGQLVFAHQHQRGDSDEEDDHPPERKQGPGEHCRAREGH